MSDFRRTGVLLAVFCAFGCASVSRPTADDAPAEGKSPPRAKTLLAWSAGRDDKPDEKDKEGEEKEGNQRKEGNGAGAEKSDEKPDVIVTDRPDFTEASSTVGKGRVQLEAGHTFTRDRSGGVTTISHSYPEALLRIGAFADWLEFRVAQNFAASRGGSPPLNASGAEDLYLGVKLGLTEQKGVLPELALILQTTVPTGPRALTAGRMQPGFNLCYGWDVVPDFLTLSGGTQPNWVVDPVGHGYVELAQSLSVGYELTEKFGAYTEWFAFFPSGAAAPATTARHFLDGGFTYKVTPNFQLDIRAGIGLSRRADDFFAGTGFAIRY